MIRPLARNATTGAVGAVQAPTDLIDAIRGLAAAYVMLGHARLFLVMSLGSLAALGASRPIRFLDATLAVTRYGHVAVLAFFLVSGYAIHYRQAHRLATGQRSVISWRSYAWHRFRRIYPTLCVALAVTAVLATVGGLINPNFYVGKSSNPDFGFMYPPNLRDLVGTLLFSQTIATQSFAANIALWSLAYEGFYYVTYPIVLNLNRRIGPTYCLLTFVGVGAAATISVLLMPQVTVLRLLAYWPVWVGGVFIADARAGRARVSPVLWSRLAMLGGIALIALSGGLLMAKMQDVQVLALVDLLWIPALFGPLGWLAASRHSSAVRGLLVSICRPFMALGAMSYSLYVVHQPVLAFIAALWTARDRQLPELPWLLGLGVIAAIAVSYVVHRVAERPFMSSRATRKTLLPLQTAEHELAPQTQATSASPVGSR